MKSIFSKVLRTKKRDVAITVVSGLPRSGTSMMMQMLEAGGMPVVTDNIRKADENNPRGYYEFEPVKKVKEDNSCLENCPGKAFKMVSKLLYHLPNDRHYKVIFMTRKMKEMLTSQRVMLERLGRKGGTANDEKLAEKFEKHHRNLKEWMARQSNIDVIFMNYNNIIREPLENARVVSQFLGNRLNAEKMARIVEKSLYRQRKDQDTQRHMLERG